MLSGWSVPGDLFVNPDLILAKLESLERCIRRIEGKAPATLRDLENDPDIQDIIVLNLERAVQQCVDLGLHILSASGERSPLSMAQTFEKLANVGFITKTLAHRLALAVGFRNIAVHEYESLSWPIVFSIVQKGMADFRLFAAAVLTAVESNETEN